MGCLCVEEDFPLFPTAASSWPDLGWMRRARKVGVPWMTVLFCLLLRQNVEPSQRFPVAGHQGR